MRLKDLDDLHRERVSTFMKSYSGDDSERPMIDLFTSQRVVETIYSEKAFVDTFNVETVLALLPFHSSIYMRVCENCVRKKNFDAFKTLVESRLVIPVLSGQYKHFPEPVTDFLLKHDHMSVYEYGAFRLNQIISEAKGGLCSHCTQKRVRAFNQLLKGKRGAPRAREEIRRIAQNAYPFVDPDFSLLDLIEDACRRGDLIEIARLSRISEGIYQLRSARALNGSITLDEDDLSVIPERYSSETDAALLEIERIRKMAAEGLGLIIPVDVPLSQYVEIVKDYGPAIQKVLDEVQPRNDAPLSIGDATRKVSELNAEVDRIKNLKRYAVLEAGVSFFKNNRGIASTALIAAAFGATGNLLGCAATVATAGGLKVLKKRGAVKSSPEIAKAGRLISRDLQPQIDRLVSKYVRASIPAINVLSLRKRLLSRMAA